MNRSGGGRIREAPVSGWGRRGRPRLQMAARGGAATGGAGRSRDGEDERRPEETSGSTSRPDPRRAAAKRADGGPQHADPRLGTADGRRNSGSRVG